MSYFNETGQDKARKKYRGWWVGKMCRTPYSNDEFKKVIDIETFGSLSFITGSAELIFEDYSRMLIKTSSYTPRKQDIEIEPRQ